MVTFGMNGSLHIHCLIVHRHGLYITRHTHLYGQNSVPFRQYKKPFSIFLYSFFANILKLF